MVKVGVDVYFSFVHIAIVSQINLFGSNKLS